MNDLKYKMLGDLGYSGSLDDRRFAFYKSNGAVSNNVNDAEFEWLGGLGFTSPSIRDRWNAYFNTIGFGDEKSEYAVARADNLYFSPRNLFLAGEKGVWYDPSDMSTLFQDAAGTTPVTAVGQPVGLMLDKSKGLVLGSELVTNGDFSSSTGWTLSSGVVVAADVCTFTNVSVLNDGVVRIGAIQQNRFYRITYTINSISSGTLASFVAGNYGPARTTPGQYTEVVFSGTSTTNFGIVRTAGVANAVIDNISVRELPGNHATQPTSTSRPVLGLADGKYYLTFDGVDDWLSTAAIDFTGTDKMTVVAGVRKLSDAAHAIVAELGTGTGNGLMVLSAPGPSAGATYRFASAGTIFVSTVTPASFAAPHSAVLTGIGSISGDVSRIRVNGAISEALTDQGTGNYGNYPLYIGRRGGTTLPFNGRLYGLVVRGAQSSNLFIDYAERYLNRRTGAY